MDRHRTRVAYVRAVFGVMGAFVSASAYDHEGVLYDSASPLAVAVLARWRAWWEGEGKQKAKS